MEGLEKLTYELSLTNILDQVSLKHQYTHPMMENIVHIHTYAYFSFLFIHFFIIFFLFFIFFTYIQMHIP